MNCEWLFASCKFLPRQQPGDGQPCGSLMNVGLDRFHPLMSVMSCVIAA
uniref:Uncharacterized protein n=1 Tax=Rhizobium rhizogenes TaxID=359 RepID=A0A7S4ZS14_RHIRH|nr:hypothetical protein pC5.8b_362 [Rhizobium rhizogenes]